MGLLLFYLFLALGISFICSIMESVLLSTSMPFIETKLMKGRKSALLLKKYKNEIDKPLSAILSLNTVAHTIGAAGVGAQAIKIFGETYFGIVSAILTLLILIFTEIIPKTIGAMYWRDFALISARILQVMIILAFPLVKFSELITRLISRKEKAKSISREEIAMLANLGHEEGVFEKRESKVIYNMIMLKTIKIHEAMTPRTVIAAAPEDMSLEEFYNNSDFLSFSRIPVYTDNIDHVTGYVLKDTVLSKLADDNHTMKLKELKRPVIISYENLALPVLFEQFLYKKEHIAMVVDEYGGVRGLITMEDILETLLGLEIVDESDTNEDMQKLAKERWLKIRDKKSNN